MERGGEQAAGRFERESVRFEREVGGVAVAVAVGAATAAGVVGVGKPVVREIGVRDGGEREVWGDSPTLATFRRESVREMRESARERRERRESGLSISSRRESGMSISSTSSRRESGMRREARRESVASIREGGESSSGTETASSPPAPPNSSLNKAAAGKREGGLRPLSLGTQEVRARRWRDAMEELRKM